ncbi:MAG TPA: SRPBCC family protein [Casimicrobiaceae bacterium]|jgi:uncharacterized protein YndB with AHSA1/START domain
MARPLRVVGRFGAPAMRIFGAWLDPALARQWLFATASHPIADIEIDARAAGSFRLVDVRDGSSMTYAGRYVAIVPNRRLIFTLALPQRPDIATRVTVEVDTLASRSTMTLLHENVPADLAAHARARWTGMFHGLGLLLDSGFSSRAESFDDPHCRFRAAPIDYNVGPSHFTIIRSER